MIVINSFLLLFRMRINSGHPVQTFTNTNRRNRYLLNTAGMYIIMQQPTMNISFMTRRSFTGKNSKYLLFFLCKPYHIVVIAYCRSL